MLNLTIEQIDKELEQLRNELEQLERVTPRLTATLTAIGINVKEQNVLWKVKRSLQNIVPSRTGGGR